MAVQGEDEVERHTPDLVDALVAQSPLGVALYDAEGRVTFGNAAYERQFGIRLADVPPDYSLFDDAQLEAAGLLPLIRRAYAGETVVLPPVRYDAARAARGPGREVWTQGHCYPVRDAAGRVAQVAIVHIDVTEWATARLELRANATELEAARAESIAILESISDAFYAVDAEFHFTFINRRAEDLWGLRREELLGRHYWTMFAAAVGSESYQMHQRVMTERQPVRYETLSPILHRWIEVSLHPAADGGLSCYFRDISARRAAEDERVRLYAAERAAREQAEAARERIASLQALTAELSIAATREEVARRVVLHARDVFGAVGVVVACLSAAGDQLEIVDVGDMPDDVLDDWRRFALTSPVPLADVARTGEPLYLESRVAWLARYPQLAPLLDATGHCATAVLPLVVDGRVIGVLGAAFDVPRTFGDDDRSTAIAVAHLCAQAMERTRLFDAERAARREAEAANEAKSQFLAVMSHELRTPLNAIDGYAELMEMGIRGPVTEQQREDLARIRKSQRHLLGLINGVLNYSRIEAGAVRYLVEAVPLDEVLATCEALISPQARGRRLTLHFAGCDRALRVRGDGEKVQQIVLNLLSNAVKFTEPGGRVELAAAPAGALVRITVADTGRGIAADRLEHVFEPFVQVDATRTRTQEGMGLGLAISRDLARGMGGDLTAESAAGVGSTFTLMLPGAEDEV